MNEIIYINVNICEGVPYPVFMRNQYASRMFSSKETAIQDGQFLHQMDPDPTSRFKSVPFVRTDVLKAAGEKWRRGTSVYVTEGNPYSCGRSRRATNQRFKPCGQVVRYAIPEWYTSPVKMYED